MWKAALKKQMFSTLLLPILLPLCSQMLSSAALDTKASSERVPDGKPVENIKLEQIFVNGRQKRQSDDGDGPGPVELKTMSSLARGVRCRGMRILDEKTLEIDELDYDGEGPAAWFMVGNHGSWEDEFVDLGGTIIPDENGSCDLLKEYNAKDMKLVLPGEMKWSDFNYLSIFCLRFNHNFGSVGIPSNMNLPNGTGKGTNLEECDQSPEEAIDTGSSSGGSSGGNTRPARPSNSGSSGGTPSSGGGGLLGGLLNILG